MRILVIAALALACAATAAAQGYPGGPVKLVVGFPPGGANDILAQHELATRVAKQAGVKAE